MPFCYVCGREIHPLIWKKHCYLEKREHGEDIYERLKAERDKLYDESENKKLDDF